MAATRGVAPGWIGAAPLALRNGVSRAVPFQVLRTSIWTVMAAEIKIFGSRNCRPCLEFGRNCEFAGLIFGRGGFSFLL